MEKIVYIVGAGETWEGLCWIKDCVKRFSIVGRRENLLSIFINACSVANMGDSASG